MSASSNTIFPAAFHCYKPNNQKVYGSICISPLSTILLVRGRKSNKWSFPKGHKDGNETYLECVNRETYEEAGIDLLNYVPSAFQRLSVGEYYFYELPYEVETEIQDTREIMEARWMSLNEMKSEKCNVDVNAFLSKIKRKGWLPWRQV
jgi:8-oxo-dGTP pyrophosphatase MutT (NUDIX family)